jgi:hypothetical protein
MYQYTSPREELLRNLYGEHFNREIGTPTRGACYHLNVLLNKLDHHEGLGDPFYCTVYNYNQEDPIPFKKPAPGWTYNYRDNVILDRIFFDFDKPYNQRARDRIDKELPTVSRKREFILELMEAGRLKEPIDQAKDTARYITKHYGGDPLLVFSGSKGCHLYIFFRPVKLEHPKECLTELSRELEKMGLFKIDGDKDNPGLLDRAPIGDLSRLSRAPSSIHPSTGLYCHPFKVDTPYLEIIENSKREDPPFIEYNPEAMRGSLDKVLLQIDNKIKKRVELQRYQRQFNKLEPKHPHPGGAYKWVKIESPGDVLLLNQWPCFKNSTYDHDLRLIIASLCLWSGLSPEDTGEALRIYSMDRGIDREFHLQDPARVSRDLLQGEDPKYIYTCSSMKSRGRCKECKKYFYLQLDLHPNFKEKLKGYDKNIPGGA